MFGRSLDTRTGAALRKKLRVVAIAPAPTPSGQPIQAPQGAQKLQIGWVEPEGWTFRDPLPTFSGSAACSAACEGSIYMGICKRMCDW